MKLRIVPYKMNSMSARALANALSDRLGYKVWRGKPVAGQLNVSWGYHNPKQHWGPVQWVNRPSAVEGSRNKVDTFNCLQKAGVSHVPYTTSTATAIAWQADGFTVFARTATGQAGSGIQIVLPQDPLPLAPLYTQYVKKKKEFRVHVFNGKAIFIQEKRKKNGAEADPLIRSHKRGWVFCIKDIVEPDGLRELGVAAVRACGLDFGAVDIIYNEHYNKLYVLEINSAPGIEASSLNAYVEEIVNYVGH